MKEPNILGHESAGTVIKCGERVYHLKVGDRVAIEVCKNTVLSYK